MKPSAGALEPPAYSLGSVDKALRVIHLLRNGNPIQVSVVARRLDIGVSTAHRIMSMLVFHGFAVQDSQRRYLPGPALGAPVLMARDVSDLELAASPILESLAERTGETVNLTLRVGSHARVLMAVGTHGRASMDRSGAVIPAYSTAAGRAALAGLSREQLERLFRGPAAERAAAALDERAFEELVKELNRTRSLGYALSRGSAVQGIGAVALPVAVDGPRPISITIAVLTDTERLDALLEDPTRMAAIRRAAAELSEALNVGSGG